MLPVGKLESEILKKLVFENIKYKRPEVMTRAAIGEDCAVVDFGQYECVMSTDPITAAISDIGRLAIHISCNDIASNGIEPLAIMLVVMLPEGTTEDEVEKMMKQAAETAAAVGVEIVGGHTEITPAVRKPVIVSTAIGRACKGQSQSAACMKAGDYIYMTKSAGIEGAGIIACDFGDELKEVLTEGELEKARSFLDSISVVKEGVIAGGVGTCGMHDVTEGGILGAIWEMCSVAGKGAEIWRDNIIVDEVTDKICKHYGIDCLRLISSGCMLIIVPSAKKEAMEKALKAENLETACIGMIKPEEAGIYMIKSQHGTCAEEKIAVEPPGSDEIYKVVK